MVRLAKIVCLIGLGLAACHPIDPIGDSFSAAPPQGVVGLIIPHLATTGDEQAGLDLFLVPTIGFVALPKNILLTPHQIDGYSIDRPYGKRDVGPVAVDQNFKRALNSDHFIVYTFGRGGSLVREMHGFRSYHVARFGWLDFGWVVIEGDHLDQLPIGTDFEEALHENQEVFVLRPVVKPQDILPIGPLWSADSLDRHLESVSADIPSFEWVGGRLLSRRRVPQLGVDTDNVPADLVYIAFEPETHLNGFSGSPILVRDGDSWIAVGILASGISSIRIDRRDYTLGIGVRPDLRALDSQGQTAP